MLLPTAAHTLHGHAVHSQLLVSLLEQNQKGFHTFAWPVYVFKIRGHLTPDTF